MNKQDLPMTVPESLKEYQAHHDREVERMELLMHIVKKYQIDPYISLLRHRYEAKNKNRFDFLNPSLASLNNNAEEARWLGYEKMALSTRLTAYKERRFLTKNIINKEAVKSFFDPCASVEIYDQKKISDKLGVDKASIPLACVREIKSYANFKNKKLINESTHMHLLFGSASSILINPLGAAGIVITHTDSDISSKGLRVEHLVIRELVFNQVDMDRLCALLTSAEQSDFKRLFANNQKPNGWDSLPSVVRFNIHPETGSVFKAVKDKNLRQYSIMKEDLVVFDEYFQGETKGNRLEDLKKSISVFLDKPIREDELWIEHPSIPVINWGVCVPKSAVYGQINEQVKWQGYADFFQKIISTKPKISTLKLQELSKEVCALDVFEVSEQLNPRFYGIIPKKKANEIDGDIRAIEFVITKNTSTQKNERNKNYKYYKGHSIMLRGIYDFIKTQVKGSDEHDFNVNIQEINTVSSGWLMTHVNNDYAFNQLDTGNQTFESKANVRSYYIVQNQEKLQVLSTFLAQNSVDVYHCFDKLIHANKLYKSNSLSKLDISDWLNSPTSRVFNLNYDSQNNDANVLFKRCALDVAGPLKALIPNAKPLNQAWPLWHMISKDLRVEQTKDTLTITLESYQEIERYLRLVIDKKIVEGVENLFSNLIKMNIKNQQPIELTIKVDEKANRLTWQIKHSEPDLSVEVHTDIEKNNRYLDCSYQTDGHRHQFKAVNVDRFFTADQLIKMIDEKQINDLFMLTVFLEKPMNWEIKNNTLVNYTPSKAEPFDTEVKKSICQYYELNALKNHQNQSGETYTKASEQRVDTPKIKAIFL